MATNTTFSFNQLDEPVFTTDLFYDLFDGGYIKPEELLSDKKQAEAVIDAVHTIKSFLEQAENVGVIEIG